MIYLASALIGYQVVSLADVKRIATVGGILIDPNRFSVAGLWVQTRPNQWRLLLSQSLRQINQQKVIINDSSDLNEVVDLPALQPILKIDYQIPGKKIVSTQGQHLGRAEDFSFNDDNFQIMHIFVKPPLHRRLHRQRLQFMRQQIEKISDKKIEVNIDPHGQSLRSLPKQVAS